MRERDLNESAIDSITYECFVSFANLLSPSSAS